jgi:predicted cupin superfamily sugar epimerase
VDAADIIARLGLIPHPEGGHYAETFRDPAQEGRRGAVTHIYFLLAAGEVSRWHRIDAAEIWHWYGGAALELGIALEGGPAATVRLGLDLAAGERPSAVVPARHWQSAASAGAWSLVGCTVAPAFSFDGFEMAPPGWNPGGSST